MYFYFTHFTRSFLNLRAIGQNETAILSIPFQFPTVDYSAHCCGVFLPLLGRGGFRKRKAGFLQTKKTLVCGKKMLGERNFKKLAKSLGEMILEKKTHLGNHVSFTISFL